MPQQREGGAMSRKAGWKKLPVKKNERDKTPEPQPGEGGTKTAQPDERKSSSKKKRRQAGVPQEGGHSQASISEQENAVREGGHSQSSNGVNPHKAAVRDGGHSQSSTGKQPHYGHFGRYNDQIDT